MKLLITILSLLGLLVASDAGAQAYGNKNGTVHILGAIKLDSGNQIPTINMSQRWKNKFKDTVAMIYRDSLTGALMYMNMGVSGPVGGGGRDTLIDTSTNIVASNNVTGITNTTSTLYAYTDTHGGATFHTYTLKGYLTLLSNASATVVSLLVSYTNENGDFQAAYPFCAGGQCSGTSTPATLNFSDFSIRVKGGTVITVFTNLSGGGTAVYNAGSILQLFQ